MSIYTLRKRENILWMIVKTMKSGCHEPRSSSSCAACKFLKRRCSPKCRFAPYFKSDEAKKFARVHKVFGASNVGKILSEVAEEQREDAVNSLAYEAEARLKDPVYGCIGAISILYTNMLQLQHDLSIARARLARCAAAAAAAAAYTDCVNCMVIPAQLPPLPVAATVCSGGYNEVLCYDQNSLELINCHGFVINDLITQDPFLF